MTRPALTFGLAALVHALAVKAGHRPVVEDIRSTPWSSITFTGMRHCFALRFEGERAKAAADALSKGLDYTEFDLRRYILVDIAIVENEVGGDYARLAIEALILAND